MLETFAKIQQNIDDVSRRAQKAYEAVQLVMDNKRYGAGYTEKASARRPATPQGSAPREVVPLTR